MQTLVATSRRSWVPNNRVVRSIRRCDPGRPPAVLTLAPGKHDRRWICRGNLVGPDRAGVVVKRKICSQICMIGDSRRPSVSARDISLGHR